MKGLILILIYLHFCGTENVSSIFESPSTTSQSKTTKLPTTTLPITTYNGQIGDITSTSQHQLSSIRYNRKYRKFNKGRDSLQIILGTVLGILIVFTIVFVIVLFFLRRWIQRKRLENRNGAGFINPVFDESNSRQHTSSEFVLSSISERQDKDSDHVDDEDGDGNELRDIKPEDAKSKLTYRRNDVSEMTDDSTKENNVPVIKDNHSRGLRKSVNLLGDDMSVNGLVEEESYKIKPCADGDTMSNHGIILSAPIDDTRRNHIELPVENMTDIA